VDTSLQLTHEGVHDVPLLLGFLIKLGFPQELDRHLPAHPLHQGLSNGWLITVWITYILSQADHCKCHDRDWAANLHHTLESVTGQPFRPSTLPTIALHWSSNDSATRPSGPAWKPISGNLPVTSINFPSSESAWIAPPVTVRTEVLQI